ncbi:MAG TPA: hypothetical protein VMA13_00820, partial [Candidatus Saccharimonadales bacterium]|nr:hypothetical protein [Candidatus Saccharimonadales bacterium]
LRAQNLPNGDWLFQTFDSNICGWLGLSGATLPFDPSQDNTGNGGGSCRVSTDFSQSGVFMVSAANVDCCFCNIDAILETSNYVSLDFDVKWDNSSTVPLSYFNTNSASSGILVEAGTSAGGTIMCNSPIIISNAATNGWVHISAAISQLPFNVSFTSIIFETAYAGYGTGTVAAFWLDNVKLVGHTSRPIMSTVRSGGGDFTLSWTATYGTTYSVFKSTNMVNWTTLITGYPDGGAQNSPLSYTDSVVSDTLAFYRISTP